MKNLLVFILIESLCNTGGKAQTIQDPAKLTARIYRVALKKDLIPDTVAIKPGMGNVFFSAEFSRFDIKIPKDWKNTEVAALIENDSLLVSVFIARYKDEKGMYRYFADRNGNNDITDEKELEFIRATDALTVADFLLTVRSKTGKTQDNILHYQLINPVAEKDKDKYVYGLLKEYETGILQLENFSAKIELYNFFRRPYLRSNGDGLTFFIDFNGDGFLNKKQNTLDARGLPVRSERVLDIQAPLRINNTVVKFRRLDTEGNWIEFEKQNTNTGFGEGFIIPAENSNYKSLSGNPVYQKIIPEPGGLTLLILSSKTCVPCERIRPALNKLHDEFKSKGLNSFILLKENDPEEVSEYLSKHEYNAQALIGDKERWTKLNSETIVPMFYVINSRGEIVYKDIGAGIDQESLLRYYIKKSLL